MRQPRLLALPVQVHLKIERWVEKQKNFCKKKRKKKETLL